MKSKLKSLSLKITEIDNLIETHEREYSRHKGQAIKLGKERIKLKNKVFELLANW